MSDRPNRPGLPASHDRRDFLAGACRLGTAGLCLLQAARLDATSRAGTEHAYPIPQRDGVSIDRDRALIRVRDRDRVIAMSLACPHQQAAVRWVARDARFACTKHDSRYEVDGRYVSGRATRALDRFPIRREGTNVMVTTDRVFRADVDPEGWARAVVVVP